MMKWLPLVVALFFASLSAPAATVSHSHRASHRQPSRATSPGSSAAKKSNRPPNSANRTGASLRTASLRMPARTTDQTPRKATVASKSSTSSARKKVLRKKRTSRAPIQKAPTAERISEIQSALARGGYYSNDPNGKWDGDTVSALQKFQSANGLEPTGKLDALSLQKMGLGSEIAGVSAPRPLVHPSSLTASPVSGSSAPAGGTSPSDAPRQ